MTNRNLTVMGIVATLLVGLYILQKTWERKPSAGKIDEARIAGSWKVENVARIEVYRGKADEAVVIEKGTEWTLPKSYGSRGDAEKAVKLLETLRDLTGTLRGKGAEIYKDFGLEEDKALHVVLKGPDGVEIDHFLAGKRAPGWDQSFVRRAASDEVYVATRDVAKAAGVGSDDAKPEATAWLDLSVAKLDKGKIAALQILGPSTLLEFKREEKKKEKPPDAPPDLPDKDKKKEEEKKEYQWVQAGGLTYEVKEEGVRSILDALGSLKADDVADPAKAAEYGLGSPRQEARVTLEGEAKPWELRVGAETAAKSGKFYAQVNRAGAIFVVSRSTLEGVFKKGRDVMELPSLETPSTYKIGILGPHRDIVMEMSPEQRAMIFTTPAIQRVAKFESVRDYFRRISEYRPEDVAAGLDLKAAGLEPPEHRAVFEGERRTSELRVGAKVPGDEMRRFCMLSTAERIFIVPEADIENLFPKLKEFVEYRPIPANRTVLKIETTLDGHSVLLERGETWSVRVRGCPLSGSSGAGDPYVEFVQGLQAQETLNKLAVEAPKYTLALTFEDQSKVQIEAGKSGDRCWARVGGQLIQIDEGEYNKLDRKLDSVCEKILFKKRDAIENVSMKTEAGEKAMDKARLPELKVEEILTMEKKEESGVEGSKTALAVKTREARQTLEHTVVFGAQPPDRKDMRYAWYSGSECLLLVKEELYQTLIK